MKKMKKLLALLLAMAMVLGLSATALADPADSSEKPKSTDHTTATVENVESGATITAYRIVEPKYNDYGFVEYTNAEGITKEMLNNPLEPQSNEVTAIAKQISNGKLNGLLKNTDLKIEGIDENKFVAGDANDEGLASFTAELTPGYWIVIVSGSNVQEIYNPMLVGVYYKVSGSDNTLGSGSVDANTNWSLKSEPVYAKSAQPTLTKTITGSTGKTESDGNDHGNDVAAGHTVSFKIDTVIPSYSNSYKEVRVEISDTLSEGLTLQTGTVKVSVDGTVVEESEGTFELTAAAEGFTIVFDSNYALKENGKGVVVTYDAVLRVVYDEKGVPKNVNFDPSTNTAKLTYTNDPSNKNMVKEIDDETYTYTFGIDTNLGGEDSYTTGELFKVDENETKIEKTDEKVTVNNPLPNATFVLAKAAKTDNDGNPVAEPDGHYATIADSKIEKVSNAEGRIVFDGLDAGAYILEETVAPEGYSLEGKQHTVVIRATYVKTGENKGRLESYTITIDGQSTSTYTAEYEKDNADRVIITADHTGEANALIKNTKLVNLPSTGGIGTTIFTIGGCAIMIIAAGLYFASRRKRVK